MIKQKKLFIFLFGVCLLLVGCGDSWKSKIELTDLIIDDNYVTGKIKNKTENYYNVIINYRLKNGDFTNDSRCILKVKPNSTDDVKCIESNYNDSYSVEIKDVELSELTIPKLDHANLDEKSIEYYYEEIFNEHINNIISLAYDVEDFEYPFINKVTYSSDDTIEFTNSFNYNGKLVFVTDVYKVSTNKVSYILVAVDSYISEEDLTDLISRITGMYSVINDSVLYTLDMYQALMRTDYEQGKCRLFGDWCVSADYGDPLISFYLERE